MTLAMMQARRRMEIRRTKVGRTSDVGRVELSRHCGDGGRWRYTVAPRNAAAMAGSVVARSVGRQRIAACNEFSALLQQRAGRRNVVVMASNALDLAALLRWPTARWTSQRVVAMSGSALGLGALLRCPTARWTSQRVATMSGNALGLRALLRCPTALQLRPTLRCNVFVFVFF